MKKFLLGSALVVLSTGAALATDLPMKAPNIYKATPAYSWSGFYGGVHGGYGWGENKYSDGGVFVGTVHPDGGFGGLQIGYNSQFAPHWLIGGEFDFSAGDISGGLTPPAQPSTKEKIDAFGTARTRFGYVSDRNLFYVTGGVAWMHDKMTIGGPPPFLVAKQYLVGWVLGAGWEYAIDNRWSAKIEYLYASFDKNRDVNGSTARTFDPNLSTVKVGLNYRFADLAPPAQSMPVKAAPYRSSWNGGYLGVHGGYGWADYHAFDGATVQTLDLKPAGGFGGFQSGANWMMSPNWLFGLETDASYGSLKDSGATTPSANPVTSKIDALGTMRARFGYVMDNTLLYVTGGGAYGHEKTTTSSGTSKENHFGWVVGGGVEYKFAPEWSAKLEYLYMDLGKNRFDNFNASPGGVLEARNTELTVSTVKVGLNYTGPVIERLFAGR